MIFSLLCCSHTHISNSCSWTVFLPFPLQFLESTRFAESSPMGYFVFLSSLSVRQYTQTHPLYMPYPPSGWSSPLPHLFRSLHQVIRQRIPSVALGDSLLRGTQGNHLACVQVLHHGAHQDFLGGGREKGRGEFIQCTNSCARLD